MNMASRLDNPDAISLGSAPSFSPSLLIRLVGCSVLHKETDWLIRKNQWPVETAFLSPEYHIHNGRLIHRLESELSQAARQRTVLMIGACHPGVDSLLQRCGARRTPSINCIENLLGKETYAAEISQGAFFLLEEWACQWDVMNARLFGQQPEMIRAIYQMSCKYILAVRTPCSGDFTPQACHAAEMIGLPLRWIDISLDILECALAQLVAAAHKGNEPC